MFIAADDNNMTKDEYQSMAFAKIDNYLKSAKWDGSLRTLYLYTNFTCNEKCEYCWIHQNNFNESIVLTNNMLEKFIDEALSLGLKNVKLSGGEPLVNPHIVQIINALTARNIQLTIESNGTHITSEFIHKLQMTEKLLFKISLDSLDDATNAKITQKKNSLGETLAGINTLSKNNADFDIVTVATKHNFHELLSLIEKVKQLNAKSHRIILNIQPIGHGIEMKNLNLSITQIGEIIESIYSLKSDIVSIGTLHSTLPPAFIPLQKLDLSFCAWGEAMCGIMPNGDVSVCAPAFKTMDIVAGNINENSLTDIWKKASLFTDLRQITSLEGVCGLCIFMPACRGMCRIFAKAKYGRYSSPYPFCQELYENNLFPEYSLRSNSET